MDFAGWEAEEGQGDPCWSYRNELFIKQAVVGKFSLSFPPPPGLATFNFSWEILFFQERNAEAHRAAPRCPSPGTDQYGL